MENKKLNYQEFMELSKQNYCKGGEVFYECWEEYQFDDYVHQFGPITKERALKIFNIYKNLD